VAAGGGAVGGGTCAGEGNASATLTTVATMHVNRFMACPLDSPACLLSTEAIR
jgi:hypothetical protein